MSDKTSNLTGGQIQEALDFLIYKGLEPVVRYSTIFDIQVSHLLGVAATNRKRKISALPREEFVNNLCNVLMSTDPDVRLNLLANSRIERGFVYRFLVGFLAACEGYSALYTRYLTSASYQEQQTLGKQLAAIERHVGFTRDHLFSTLRIVEQYLGLAYEFRNNIVNQYLKHAYKQAHTFCKQKVGTFNFNDLYQTLMAAIIKAIDKYDSSRGALTSYINYWILNAMTYSNTSFGYEYGVAYSIPQLQRKTIQGDRHAEVNFSVSLDQLIGAEDESTDLKNFLVGDPGVDVKLEESDELDTILYLIKKADSNGLVRLYNDIDEFFSDSERRRMARTMRRQLGYLPKDMDVVLPPREGELIETR